MTDQVVTTIVYNMDSINEDYKMKQQWEEIASHSELKSSIIISPEDP